MTVEFRLLGSIGISHHGLVLPLGGAKTRLVLAMLLVHRNSVVSVDQLVHVLWGDEPPRSAVPTLQSHLSRLRRHIHLAGGADPPGGLVARAPGYVLEVPAYLVDAGQFEEQLRLAQTPGPDPVEASHAYEMALDLWRGPAMAEFAAEDWARPEAARLDELRLVAIEGRIEAQLAAGRHQIVVGELEALVASHPLRERLWGHLMLAQHRSGRPAEALRAAQELRRYLREELGLEPSAALRQLESDILNEAPGLAWDDLAHLPPGAAPDVSATAPLGGPGSMPLDLQRALPMELTPLIGREPDLSLARALVNASRLVTLVGPGGVGKTRLAMRLARDSLERFADGVRVVELASVRDQSAVLLAVAAVLDVQQGPDRSVQSSIIELLAPSRLLLVLDNCEHVVEAVSELTNRVLRWCPNVSVLATSRESLGIPGEVVWTVPPLPLPASRDASPREVADSAAVALFVARAQAVRADFVLTDTNRQSVAEVCIRLDGMPLALELAAARMRSMDAKDLANRLDTRFKLLDGSRRVADPRYQTLYEVAAWSYELASPTEQVMFDRLSVFVGGFELEQAEQVCAGDGIDVADVARLLANLVDKSMVAVSRTTRGVRYHLLETLREFGRQHLDNDVHSSAILRDRHRKAFVGLVEAAEIGLLGPEEGQWMVRLDLEFDNLREAHATAIADEDVDMAMRLVAAGHEYGFRRIRYEQLAWADSSVQLGRAQEHRLYPIVLGVVAYGQFVRGELKAAMATGRRGVEAAKKLRVGTGGLPERALANAYYYLGSTPESSAWTDRMVAAVERSDDPGRRAHALYMRSVGLTSIGDFAGAARVADDALSAARASRSPTALAQASYAAGLACEQTRPEMALAQLERSSAYAEQVGNRWVHAFALTETLWLRARQGQALDALVGYLDVIEVWYRGGDWANQWLSLRHVFGLFASLRHDHAAVVLHGALHAAGATTAMPFEPHSVQLLTNTVAELRDRLGAEDFEVAVTDGGRLGGRDVVEFTLAEIRRLVVSRPPITNTAEDHQ